MAAQRMILAVNALAAVTRAAPVQHSSTTLPVVAFVSNEAETRPSPYTFDIESVTSVSNAASAVVYGPYIFGNDYTIYSRNSNDGANLETLTSIRNQTDDAMKVLVTIGGPDFPSASWSSLASSAEGRATFVTSVQTLVETYELDGVDIHWNHPGSSARMIYRMVNGALTTIGDGGGTDSDMANLVALLSELRSALGDSSVIALTVGREASIWTSDLSSLGSSVDVFFLKAFDYTTSNDPLSGGSAVTGPAQPIIDTSSKYGSVSGTLSAYLSTGVSSEKFVLVAQAYGQAWNIQNMPRDGWTSFGTSAVPSGKCSGPWESTYGSTPSNATGLCGRPTYAEIAVDIAANPALAPVQDSNTLSDLAFLTTSHVWVSYTGPNAIASLVGVAQSNRCGGVGIDSIDMDRTSDFELTMSLCQAMFGSSDERCVLASTTPAPVTDSCAGLDSGYFCLSGGAGFIVCPNEVTEPCPYGTVCKHISSNNVMCDWPDTVEW